MIVVADHSSQLQRASVVRCRPVCRVFTAAWSGEPVDSPLSSRGAPRPAGGEVVVGEERGGGGESCACAATGRDGAENGHRQAPLSLHSRRGSGRRKPHSSGIGTYGGTALGTRSPENRMRHRRSPDALLRRCTLRCSDSACAVSQPGCADRRGETCGVFFSAFRSSLPSTAPELPARRRGRLCPHWGTVQFRQPAGQDEEGHQWPPALMPPETLPGLQGEAGKQA
nr:PREDICTED: uncharacterized protein LOC107077885 isoform X3 [Lepisosteus oculatus]